MYLTKLFFTFFNETLLAKMAVMTAVVELTAVVDLLAELTAVVDLLAELAVVDLLAELTACEHGIELLNINMKIIFKFHN